MRIKVPVLPLLVVTVRIEEPDVSTEPVLKLAVVPGGNPLILKLTAPVKLPEGLTPTV